MKNRILTGPHTALALGLLSAAGVCVWLALSGPDPNRVQHLEDGSLFSLRRISFNNTNVFTHGNWLERNLGNIIPSKGINLGPLHLQRRTFESFPDEDTRGLVVEFKRLTTNAPGLLPLALRAPRLVRCLIVGDDGSDYPAEFDARLGILYNDIGGFYDDATDPIQSRHFFNSNGPRTLKRPDGEFEYLTAADFPRASAWLTFRFECSDRPALSAPNWHWEPLAQFKIKNPVSAKPHSWQSTPLPANNEIDGVRFVLNDITVHPQQSGEANMTDREVATSLRVLSNGVVQSQWRVFSIRLEDALGNTRERGHPFQFRDGCLIQNDRLFLDPKQTWKFEADLAQGALLRQGDQIATEGLDPGSLCTIRVPLTLGPSLLTNVHDVPMRISPSSRYVINGQKFLDYQVEITAGHTGRRILIPALNQLRFIVDQPLYPGSPRGAFIAVPDNGGSDADLTFALVKNYHLEFFVKPTLSDRPPAPPGTAPRP